MDGKSSGSRLRCLETPLCVGFFEASLEEEGGRGGKSINARLPLLPGENHPRCDDKKKDGRFRFVTNGEHYHERRGGGTTSNDKDGPKI